MPKSAIESWNDNNWHLLSASGELPSSAVVQNWGPADIALGFTANSATPPAHTGGVKLASGAGASKDQIANLQTIGATFAIWARRTNDLGCNVWVDHA